MFGGGLQVDAVRSEKDKGGMTVGYKLAPPGQDVKKTMQVWNLLFSNPFLAQVFFKQVSCVPP